MDVISAHKEFCEIEKKRQSVKNLSVEDPARAKMAQRIIDFYQDLPPLDETQKLQACYHIAIAYELADNQKELKQTLSDLFAKRLKQQAASYKTTAAERAFLVSMCAEIVKNTPLLDDLREFLNELDDLFLKKRERHLVNFARNLLE